MNTGVMLDLIEPLYTEPYVRWCEREIYFSYSILATKWNNKQNKKALSLIKSIGAEGGS